ncbi:MAG: molybdopterin converting factor small subunit [Flavobacteriales bacterium]|jgi:molybdopterin converting factor small subunit
MATIHIHYFGEIAEKTGTPSETIEVTLLSTSGVLEFLKKTYQIQGNGVQVAVNQELVTENTPLSKTDEIAILSPFAGG